MKQDSDAIIERFAALPLAGDENESLADISNPHARVINASGVDIHV